MLFDIKNNYLSSLSFQDKIKSNISSILDNFEYILITENDVKDLTPYLVNIYNKEYYLDYLIFCDGKCFPEFYDFFNIYAIFDVFIYSPSCRVDIVCSYYATICSEVGSDLYDPYLLTLIEDYNLCITSKELWEKSFSNNCIDSSLYSLHPIIVIKPEQMTL